MTTPDLQVALHLSIDDTLRGYFMTRRRSLLTELDDLEKLLGITPRTSEIRKREKAQYNCETEKKEENE